SQQPFSPPRSSPRRSSRPRRATRRRRLRPPSRSRRRRPTPRRPSRRRSRRRRSRRTVGIIARTRGAPTRPRSQPRRRSNESGPVVPGVAEARRPSAALADALRRPDPLGGTTDVESEVAGRPFDEIRLWVRGAVHAADPAPESDDVAGRGDIELEALLTYPHRPAVESVRLRQHALFGSRACHAVRYSR